VVLVAMWWLWIDGPTYGSCCLVEKQGGVVLECLISNTCILNLLLYFLYFFFYFLFFSKKKGFIVDLDPKDKEVGSASPLPVWVRRIGSTSS